MTYAEAKTILLLYRNAADAADPQIAEALALVKTDAELAKWFSAHLARQEMLRQAFRQIEIPDELKEKILAAAKSKKSASQKFDWKIFFFRPQFVLPAAAILIACLILLPLWLQHHRKEQIFSIFQNQMISVALRPYSMDLETNNPVEIRNHFARSGAPADYSLPDAIEKMESIGCAVQHWNGQPVSMICLRTGKPISSGRKNDLWLFVADRAAVKDFPEKNSPRFSKADGLTTAYWIKDDKFYFLGTEADVETIRKWL